MLLRPGHRRWTGYVGKALRLGADQSNYLILGGGISEKKGPVREFMKFFPDTSQTF